MIGVMGLFRLINSIKEVNMADVRITVVKRLDNQELYGDNPPLTFTGVISGTSINK